MLIFANSQKGRCAESQLPRLEHEAHAIPEMHLRKHHVGLPEVSELQVIRHYTNLSRKNFSIDTHFYPLGSCTMKYNPRGVQAVVNKSGFLKHHPLSPDQASQGWLACLYELQEYLKEITGMKAVSLTPMAGSQGEFAGVAMIKAYHHAKGDHQRTEILVPDAAHGTNPASAAMCGYTIREIPTGLDGELDLLALSAALGPQTAGIMLTNPSTLGVFAKGIDKIAAMVHQAGGLLYYDGANLNAILGKVRPGDMGFDVMHLNLHKTFATPHGGGGPGSGPVGVSQRLIPHIPTPIVVKEGDQYRWSSSNDFPQSIGRLSTFMGNAGILLRAYAYIRLLGREGLMKVAEYATLNANYLMKRLSDAGYTLAYPARRASHEFIVTLSSEKKRYQITAMDLAKRLIDYGFHPPTTYFPLLVPECLLIEPTETECREDLDQFIEAMISIRREMEEAPEKIKSAPHVTPVGRLDDVKAARELDLIYKD